MWLSERAAVMKETAQDVVSTGEVTMGGAVTGVYTNHEVRGAIVLSPGGYTWKPKGGDRVLVMKGSAGESYITGSLGDADAGLEEGEVKITSEGGAEILLKNNGNVILRGNIVIEGALEVNGEKYRPCTCVLGG